MKKSLICIAALALIAAGCAKEMDNVNDGPIHDNVALVEYSFTAGVDTKGDLDFTTGSYTWAAGDAIAVWDSQNSKYDTFTAQEDGTTTEFKGSGAADAVYTNAYYPASITDATAGADAVIWPASYESGTVAAKSFPLFAVNDGGNLTFKHLGAILRISVNDVPSNVDAVEFSASKAVTGQLSVDNTSPSEPKCIMGNGASSISISTSAASRTSATSEFYMPIPTGTLTGGFTINLKQGSTVVASKSTANNVTVSRAKLIKMKAFTPEGPVSTEWTVAGGFNSWNTTATPMSEVLDHDGWLVARNIDITPVSGQSAGFKFVKNNSDWHGGSASALHTQYTADGADNITFAEASYDIYYNPTSNMFFLANAGETWIYKTVYMMSDMVLSDGTYYLHVWSHDGPGFGTTWPGIEMSGTETISGMKYYKFPVAICDGDFTSGSYDCIFHNNYSDMSNSGARRYDFREGALTANNTDSAYYVSFSGNKYNKAIAEGNNHATYGENTSNPMAQFTDPTKPAGESRWGSYIGGSLKYMHWDNGPVLVVNNIEVGPSTGIRFCFDWDGGHFYGLPSAGSVSADTYFDVVHSSSAQEFTVPSLDETYICDLYLDIINNKAKVVAKAKKDANITLYFGLTDREMSHVYFYTFGDWYNHAWTGAELTDHEEINRIKYYKAVVPGTKIWDKNVNIIINDGSWQTNDFTTADWSGFKSEYYFNVVGKNIVQLSGRPAAVNITIDGNFDDWAQISGNVTGPNSKFNTTTMKAYSDGTHMFIYTKVETGSGGDHSGLGDGDIKFFFDKDNDATTGDTSTWYRIGADDTDNEFRVKLASESLRSVLADASYHASVKVTDDTTNRVMEMELKFDLAALDYNKTMDCGTKVKIFSLGYCPQEFTGNVTVTY